MIGGNRLTWEEKTRLMLEEASSNLEQAKKEAEYYREYVKELEELLKIKGEKI